MPITLRDKRTSLRADSVSGWLYSYSVAIDSRSVTCKQIHLPKQFTSEIHIPLAPTYVSADSQTQQNQRCFARKNEYCCSRTFLAYCTLQLCVSFVRPVGDLKSGC